MTMREYHILTEAYKLRQVDRNLELNQLAYLNFRATATKKNGKPVYKNFKEFFDYDKELEKVKSSKEKKLKKARIEAVGNILYNRG